MKKFALGLVCLITIFGLTGCGCSNNKNKNNSNKNIVDKNNDDVLFEDQVINDLSFEKFSITKDEDNVSTIYFEIVNNTENNIDVGTVKYSLYSNGAPVLDEKVTINKTIEAGETEVVSDNFDIDLSGANDLKYTLE